MIISSMNFNKPSISENALRINFKHVYFWTKNSSPDGPKMLIMNEIRYSRRGETGHVFSDEESKYKVKFLKSLAL